MTAVGIASVDDRRVWAVLSVLIFSVGCTDGTVLVELGEADEDGQGKEAGVRASNRPDVETTDAGDLDAGRRRQDDLASAAIVEDVEFSGPAGFVLSSFTGDGEDGLHLLASHDGFTWAKVNDYRSVFQQDTPLMRDPSIVLGPDGVYHMVWTSGWWEQHIGVAHSTDLLTWTESKLYVWADYEGPGMEESAGDDWPAGTLDEPVASNEWVRNTWAPELFFDKRTKEYVIAWSSTVDSPEVFPETWDARGDHLNHRIYYITTRDFVSYTPRRLLYAPLDRVVIDAFIAQVGDNDYRMVIKDEADSGYGDLHIVESTQPLESWADMPVGFWGNLSESPFAGSGVAPDRKKAEGPGAVLIRGSWFLYADYWMSSEIRVWSTDASFQQIAVADGFVVPVRPRHGTVVKVPQRRVDALLALE